MGLQTHVSAYVSCSITEVPYICGVFISTEGFIRNKSYESPFDKRVKLDGQKFYNL